MCVCSLFQLPAAVLEHVEILAPRESVRQARKDACVFLAVSFCVVPRLLTSQLRTFHGYLAAWQSTELPRAASSQHISTENASTSGVEHSPCSFQFAKRSIPVSVN